MNVFMVVHHYPPRYQAGVELIVRRAARQLTADGHSVEIVCVEAIDTGRPGIECVSESYEGVMVHRLSFELTLVEDRFRYGYDNPEIGRWVAARLERGQPDLVHIQSCYLVSLSPIYAAKDLELPTVLSLHDCWMVCPRVTLRRPDGARCTGQVGADECAWCLMMEQRRYRLPDRVTDGVAGRVFRWTAKRMGLPGWRKRVRAVEDRRAAIRQALTIVDGLTVSSRFLHDRLHVLCGVPKERIELITYGLDLNAWQPLPKTPRDDVLRIGYIGQLAPQKGVHVLIEAFKQLSPSARRPLLTVHGSLTADPKYVRTLQKLAGDHPSITFAGEFDNARIAEVLQQVDVLVVPSQWYETGPLVTWEAFASRTPVLATDLPNMRHQIRHGVDGLLFAPDGSEDLVRQLQRLLDEPQLVRQLAGQIGPVKSHSEEMQEMLRVYRRALGDRAVSKNTEARNA